MDASLRVAAVGDLHLGAGDGGRFRPSFLRLPDHADVLLLAGDHDHHGKRPERLATILADAGVQVLQDQAVVTECRGVRLGLAGAMGVTGGFDRSTTEVRHAHHGTDFGVTPGGVPVRNVAYPVIQRNYRIYQVNTQQRSAGH